MWDTRRWTTFAKDLRTGITCRQDYTLDRYHESDPTLIVRLRWYREDKRYGYLSAGKPIREETRVLHS